MSRNRLAFLDSSLSMRLKRASNQFVALRQRLGKQTLMSEADIPVALIGQDDEEREGAGHELVVASYNIHKCVGVDRAFSPARIGAVIAEMNADVVAIQEADERFGQRRGLLDVKSIEKETGLTLVRASMIGDGHGWHGNALMLRRGKVSSIKRLALPGAEPRGALVVDLELPSGKLRLVAAHLGLLRRSRRWQVQSILEAMAQGPRMPTLLVGDLNEWRPGRRSSLHGLKQAFGPIPHGLSSFPSYFPVVALDRVIGSPDLVTSLEVHDSPLAQVASDHLPLKARIDIRAALSTMEKTED